MFTYLIRKDDNTIRGIYNEKQLAFQSVSVMLLDNIKDSLIIEEYVINTCLLSARYIFCFKEKTFIQTHCSTVETNNNIAKVMQLYEQNHQLETRNEPLKIFIPNNLSESSSIMENINDNLLPLQSSPLNVTIPLSIPLSIPEDKSNSEINEIKTTSVGKKSFKQCKKDTKKINKMKEFKNKWHEFQNVFKVDSHVYKLLKKEKLQHETNNKTFVIPALFRDKFPQFEGLHDKNILDSPDAIYHYIYNMPESQKKKYSFLKKLSIEIDVDAVDAVDNVDGKQTTCKVFGYKVHLVSSDSLSTSSEQSSEDDTSLTDDEDDVSLTDDEDDEDDVSLTNDDDASLTNDEEHR